MPTVAVQRGPPSEARPTGADLLEGLGPGPLLVGLLADREQGRAAVLALGAHDRHAPLVIFADAATARNAVILHDLAIKVVLRLDDAAEVNPTVYAGASSLGLSRWNPPTS